MNKRIHLVIISIILVSVALLGCDKPQSASLNSRMKFNNKTTATPKVNADGQDVQPTLGANDPGYQAFIDSKSNNITTTPTSSPNKKDFGKPDASGRVGYNYDIEKDKKNYDGHPDITVGDKLYATQINDWYANFNKYKGKVVEIEGYYIDDYAPYTFVGRYGPSCPYCNGGYVSYEFYTNEDLTALKSGKDWIKVTGIIRNGEDSNGEFNYIEVLDLEKMDKVGKDTVTN